MLAASLAVIVAGWRPHQTAAAPPSSDFGVASLASAPWKDRRTA